MEIVNGIEMHDLCLYVKEEKMLVLADVHLGYEEALNKQGIMIPRFQYQETIKRIKPILEKLEIEKIIVLGDLKHEFGTISQTEWCDVLNFLELLEQYSNEIILIKGNHDRILGPIADKKNVDLVEYYETKNIFFCHGDKLIATNKPITIIGHEHPAIALESNGRVETFKCFLKNENFLNKTLIVIPSYNLVTEGTNLLQEKLLSPYLQDSLDNYETWLVSDEVYHFGKVKNFK
ncbi:MAG: metallophosphoesterase [archaeon]